MPAPSRFLLNEYPKNPTMLGAYRRDLRSQRESGERNLDSMPATPRHECSPPLSQFRFASVTQFAGFRFHRSREGGVMLDEYLGLWRSW